MVGESMTGSWSLVMTGDLWARLYAHLFPGDGDEHGAVLGARLVATARGVRLLAQTFHPATDGRDYIPGERGYRMLTPTFVRDQVLACAQERLVYLAVHCHGGSDRVGFSGDDIASHERGYPALLDVVDGLPVGGLVFARNAVAGDLWLPSGDRVELAQAVVVGRPVVRLHPAPPAIASSSAGYDRQARIFGDRGQQILGAQKVAVIGAGGGGSLIVEYLARLGVGHLVVIDPDRIDATNLPRVVGARRWEALPWLTDGRRPEFIQRIGRRLARPKVSIARRVARQASRTVSVEALRGNITDPEAAQLLRDCDHIVLAADSMQARLVVNAIVHQYLVPATAVGAKVYLDRETGEILDVFSVTRPVTPDLGCLWCNGLISPAGLQEEALSQVERARQRYVDDEDVPAPSVITLNAVAAALAVDDYLMSAVGLLDPEADHCYLRMSSLTRELVSEIPRKSPSCRECSGRLARGDSVPLPIRGAERTSDRRRARREAMRRPSSGRRPNHSSGAS